MSHVQEGHDEPVASEDGACNDTPGPAHAHLSCKKVGEQTRQNQVAEQGVIISLIRRNQPEEETQRIKDGGFKMSPIGHASKDIRVPKRDRKVPVKLIIEELLHWKIKSNKINSHEVMPFKEDASEEI
jgi:hypothetical protein